MKSRKYLVLKLIFRSLIYKIIPKSWNIKSTVTSNEKFIKILREEANDFINAINQVEAIHGENNEAEELISMIAFINLSMIDIILLFNLYIKSNSFEEKHLISRTAALHMYEFLEDGNKIFGKGMIKLASILKAENIKDDILRMRELFYHSFSKYFVPIF